MEPVEIRWRDRRNRAFVARLLFERISDRLEVVEVAIYSPARNRLIDGRVLRDIKLADVAAEGLQQLLPADLIPGELLNAGEVDAARHHRRTAAWAAAQANYLGLASMTPAGPGRRYPPGHLQRVADVYSAARRRHEAPTKAVAEAFEVSIAAAKKQVYRAREKGLLPKTTQGKASGRRAAPSNRRTKK